ncbi:MAG: DUF6265 family protein [Hyphomonadaceae bacterium]|nr:DUF6265 family protein [Hyphomonadaceae bacterium]
MRYSGLLVIAVMAQGCAAQAREPETSWLSGYWLSCTNGEQVSETWSDARGGVTLGYNFTLAKGEASWEFLRIGPRSAGPGLSLYAAPSGQPPAEFPLAQAKSADRKLVFENPAHDFPQRVIYQRTGDRLVARIEGILNGKPEAMDWSFSSAKLNESCRF